MIIDFIDVYMNLFDVKKYTAGTFSNVYDLVASDILLSLS